MKLLVNHLGPIKNNTTYIDLSKQFYVFVGANNSGKTYLSQFLWGMYFYCHEVGFRAFIEKQDTSFVEILEDSRIVINDVFLQKIANIYTDYLREKLGNLYNAYNGNSFLPAEIVLKIGDEDILPLAFTNRFTELKGRVVLIFAKKEAEKHFIVQNKLGISLERIQKTILLTVIRKLFQRQTNKFLPANRQFYPIFYQYIFQLERKNDFDEELLSTETKKQKIEKPYTKPVEILLEDLFSLSLKEANKDLHLTYIEELAAIMGGNIATNRVEGIGMANFRFEINEQKNVPLFLASSSVNQLTLLYLYFKYWAEKDKNVLFIDEPEENLHPQNQIKLLELLLKFSGEKNKVFINTHSPLLAEALNNYMYLHSLKQELGMSDAEIADIMQENGLKFINTEVAIPKEKVGVYFFDGERIIDYETDSYGVFFRDFKEVTNSISKANRVLTDYLYLSQQATENA